MCTCLCGRVRVFLIWGRFVVRGVGVCCLVDERKMIYLGKREVGDEQIFRREEGVWDGK
jgi:hypothetical protein